MKKAIVSLPTYSQEMQKETQVFYSLLADYMQALDACVFAKTEQCDATDSVDIFLGFEDSLSEDDITEHVRAVMRLYERASGREAQGEVGISDGATVLAQNPLRCCPQAEAAVRRGAVTRLPGGLWPFGGPLSTRRLAEAMVDAMLA